MTTDNDKRIATERSIARQVVRDALAAGHMISVYDGEEYAVKRSTSFAAITGAMFSTDDDLLVIRTAAGEKIGVVWLVYGNGHDVITDHTDTPAMEALLKGAMEAADRADRV